MDGEKVKKRGKGKVRPVRQIGRVVYGRKIVLRLRISVDESLEKSYDLCALRGSNRRGETKESLNSFLNRLLFEKSEEMLWIERKLRGDGMSRLRGMESLGGGGFEVSLRDDKVSDAGDSDWLDD